MAPVLSLQISSASPFIPVLFLYPAVIPYKLLQFNILNYYSLYTMYMCAFQVVYSTLCMWVCMIHEWDIYWAWFLMPMKLSHSKDQRQSWFQTTTEPADREWARNVSSRFTQSFSWSRKYWLQGTLEPNEKQLPPSRSARSTRKTAIHNGQKSHGTFGIPLCG